MREALFVGLATPKLEEDIDTMLFIYLFIYICFIVIFLFIYKHE